MIKRTITYVDFDGTERTEDFYFHFSKAEIVELESSKDGGLTDFMQRCIRTNKTSEVMPYVRNIILSSYGEKSADGKRFVKDPELTKAFAETEAFSQLYLSFFEDTSALAEFVNGLTALPGKARTAPTIQSIMAGANNAGASNT